MIADIDECETEEHNCDDANATCINNIGSFTCTCKPGYSLADGVKCRGKYSAENIGLSCNTFQIDLFFFGFTYVKLIQKIVCCKTQIIPRGKLSSLRHKNFDIICL